MILTLKIENFDQLSDGGPIEYQSRQRNFEIGREISKDWTLPDPNRFISGHHCNVTFEKGAYWLHDLSTNGTFFAGNMARVPSPYELQNGDRLQIGHFIVVVHLNDNDDSLLDPFVRSSSPSTTGNDSFSNPAGGFDANGDGDIWAVGGDIPPPIDPKELKPPRKLDPRPNFLEQHLEMPNIVADPHQNGGAGFDNQPAPFPQNPAAPADIQNAGGTPQSPFTPSDGQQQASSPFAPGQPAFPQGQPQPPQMPQQPAPSPTPATGFQPENSPPPAFNPTPPGLAHNINSDMPAAQDMYPAPATPSPPLAAQPPATPAPSAPGSSEELSGFLASLANAAGVSQDVFLQQDSHAIARELGIILRVTTQEMSKLLQARSKAKLMAKSTSRTMIGAMENNPLKFIPTPEECINMMFSNRDRTYKNGEESFREAFQDLQTHELATYAAMQTALGKLLHEFDPETIEEKATNSRGTPFGSKKSRAWEVYQEKWDILNESNQNGILDVFLSYFSKAYDENSRKD